MKVQLIVVQGKPEGKIIPLAAPVFRIGRGETCHLRPNSELVSREHAEFNVTATRVTVRDLGSRNGTLVNGKVISDNLELNDQDLVTIGTLTFAVSIQDAPVPASKPSAPAAGSAARTASPDDVSHDDIESWLIADNASPRPERPSGVYGGDTITITAFKDVAGNPTAQKEKEPAPEKEPAKEKIPPPPAAVTPAVAKPPEVAAAPAKPPEVAAAPAKPPAATPPPPKPLVATPTPAAAVSPPSLEDMEYERLPEGMGDTEPDEDFEEREENDDEDETEEHEPMMEEFVDESNPFYVKKKPKEEEVASKPVYKDSSDAASDILRKMMERRRSR